MDYLPYLSSVSTEITMEKLDRVTNTIGGKIKQFVKLFCIVFGWCVANLIVALFFNRTRSVSLDTYRLISDGLREITPQDISIIIVFLFDNRFSYAITLAMFFACGLEFIIRVLYCGEATSVNSGRIKHCKYAQKVIDKSALVVSYKQHVAFLA